MTHRPEKSDRCVVAMKSANKPVRAGAELMEPRRRTEGNTEQQRTRRTQSRESVTQSLSRVRERARLKPKERFTALLHHVTPELLETAFYWLKRNASAGIDGVTWRDYESNLENQFKELHKRIHRGSYRAQPSLRSHIPKADGSSRPLGIAALEDKLVQRALVEVMNAIYEEDFLGFSYGFRPKRSQHNALDALAAGIAWQKVNWVFDADLSKFFDSMSQAWLMKFVAHRIGDERLLLLIQKWLKAGVMEAGIYQESEVGTPQGAVISPLLANIYLHYVFDQWVEQWRKRHALGGMIVVRYADDVVVGFQHARVARRFQHELQQRLQKFALKLHPTKTRLLAFGRYAHERGKERGLSKPETFNFLGFTHISARNRAGQFQLHRHTRRDRLSAKLKEIKHELRRRWHHGIPEQGAWLNQVVRGYFAYHAVPSNQCKLAGFRYQVVDIWRRALKRRSQKDKTTWQRMRQLAKEWIPPVRITHPWPDQRFLVNHPRWEPGALIAHAGICAGGPQ